MEEFGVHVHFDGSVLYGLEVNSINIQLQVGVSVDKLSRLLVDVSTGDDVERQAGNLLWTGLDISCSCGYHSWPLPSPINVAPLQVHQDSSFLTYSLTTAYQRVLMDTMSGGSRYALGFRFNP